MPKSRKRQAVGRQNYARKDPEYAVGQRVQRGEAFGTIADVKFDEDEQTYFYSVDLEQELVELAPRALKRAPGQLEQFSVGQKVQFGDGVTPPFTP